MSVVKADRFTALKAKVKAEMLRRNQSGSVAAYGGSAYDYAQPPEKGELVRGEHREKVITPMRAVNSDLVDEAQGAAIGEEELADLETRVEVWRRGPSPTEAAATANRGAPGRATRAVLRGVPGAGVGVRQGVRDAEPGAELRASRIVAAGVVETAQKRAGQDVRTTALEDARGLVWAGQIKRGQESQGGNYK